MVAVRSSGGAAFDNPVAAYAAAVDQCNVAIVKSPRCVRQQIAQVGFFAADEVASSFERDGGVEEWLLDIVFDFGVDGVESAEDLRRGGDAVVVG